MIRYPAKKTRERSPAVSAIVGLSMLVVLMGGCSVIAGETVAPTNQACFRITDWHGWKSPSPDILYLGVGMHDVYRVELDGGSTSLQWPDNHLVSQVRGSDYICSSLDLQLSVADFHGYHEPLFIKSISKLTPEEAGAIPAKFRP